MKMKKITLVLVIVVAAIAVFIVRAVSDYQIYLPIVQNTPTPFPGEDTVRFAVIGDYGDASINEERVATLVASWNPDFIITTGDNNYPNGTAETIDQNIGQYYSSFIGNYQGDYGLGSVENRFWPSLGNHDWRSLNCKRNKCSGPYFDYFTLPSNESYYDIDYGLVHLFAIDSDDHEPDGNNESSIQAGWLQGELATSASCFNVVFFHHPPYSSGKHGSTTIMQWPFRTWGTDVVLAGHDHTYERLDADDFPFFVIGNSGRSLYGFDNVSNLPDGVDSIIRYNQDYGAMLVTATRDGITYQFSNANGDVIDEHSVAKNCDGSGTPSFTPTANP